MARRIITAKEQVEMLAPWREESQASHWFTDYELEHEFDDVQEPHLHMPVQVMDAYTQWDKNDFPPEDSWFPHLEDHIGRHGIRRPLELSTDGKWAILNDGHHRLCVANRLGMQSVPVRIDVKPTGYYDNLGGLVKPLEKTLKDWIYDHGRGMGIAASVGGGIEPTMGVDRQIRKFDQAIQDARDSGDEYRARYTEYVKQLMLDELEAGRPRPFSFYSPMIDEEFS